MYHKSIFDVPRKKEDLLAANQGMADLYYDEVASLRNIQDSGNSTNNFANGLFQFRFHPPNGVWWIPSRSYFKIDVSLTKPDGTTPLKMEDNIAINHGAMSCLFSKMQYKINDKTVSEISEHCGQVDAIKKRLRHTGQWLKTTGSNFNCWESSFIERQKKVCTDGLATAPLTDALLASMQLSNAFDWTALTNYQNTDDSNYVGDTDVNYSYIEFIDTAIADRVNFRPDGTQTGTLDTPFRNINLTEGSIILVEVNGNTYVAQVTTIQTAGLAAGNGNDLNRIYFRKIMPIEADENVQPPIAATYNIRVIQNAEELGLIKSRRVKTFSLIWQPPLSIFQIPHGIPGSSKHEIDFVPFGNATYQKNFIESLLADKVHTTDGANGSFRMRIEDMYFYMCRCSGPLVKQDQIYLDLEETRLQMNTITSNDRSQYSLDVSPSTHAFTIAFQDEAAETNTLYSQTKFKIRNSEELNLTNFYIRYAGMQKPQPDYRLSYSGLGNDDKMVELYGRSLLYNGAYFDSTTETLQEWRERGLYMHFPYPTTGTNRETRVYMSTEFSSLTGSPRLLLFNHFTKVVILKYANGVLNEVLVNEV